MPAEISDTYAADTLARMHDNTEEADSKAFAKDAGFVNSSGFGGGGNKLGAGLLSGWGFTKKLPRNIGMGIFRAALETTETIDDVMAAAPDVMQSDLLGDALEPGGPGPSANATAKPPKLPPVEKVEPLRTMFPGVFEAAHSFADEVEANNTTSDNLVQGITQFTIPFIGYLKAFGGLKQGQKLFNAAKALGAEGVTAASAFDPHDGRLGDLLDMGRHMENRFGELLNKASPDGSLANAYIDYIANRDNEGEWEGRWKNAVDSWTGTAAVYGLLKAVPVSLKIARAGIEDFGKGPLPGTRRGQRGMVAFHGSPHVFDKFDLAALGTGEGNQAYAHGFYFAENKGVAQGYHHKLAGGKFTFPDSPKAFSVGELAFSDKTNGILAAKKVADLLTLYNGDVNKALNKIKGSIFSGDKSTDKAFVFLNKYKDKQVKLTATSGALYEVDIPDKQVAKMLDWDKPIEKQPSVLKAIPDDMKEKIQYELDHYDLGDIRDVDGKTIHRALERIASEEPLPGVPYSDNLKQQVAQYLESLGVPGVTFLDGVSRKAGEGTKNIVVFNPDKTIKQVKRNGVVTSKKD